MNPKQPNQEGSPHISRPKPIAIRKSEDRTGSKTAPLETDFNFDVENNEDYISSYNYYIYYNSIKPRDPRLKKPTYVPVPNMEFIKEEKSKFDKGIKENPQDEDYGEEERKISIQNEQKALKQQQHQQQNKPGHDFEMGENTQTQSRFNNSIPIRQPLQQNQPKQVPSYYEQQMQQRLNMPPQHQRPGNKFAPGPETLNPMDMNIPQNQSPQFNNMNYDPNIMAMYMQMLSWNENNQMGMNNPMLGMNPMMLQGQLQGNQYPYQMGGQNNMFMHHNQNQNPNQYQNMYGLGGNQGRIGGNMYSNSSNRGQGNQKFQNQRGGRHYQNGNNNANFRKPIVSENASFEEILEKIIELSKDHTGSRLIQKKYEEGNEEQKLVIILKILPEIVSLSKDVFGNYVVQRWLECSNPTNKKKIIEQLFGTIQDLTIHMYGCRVIQKALEIADIADVKQYWRELQPDWKKSIEDQNGNHVIQKIIERLPKTEHSDIMAVMGNNIYNFSIHQYGCRVVQRLFDYSTDAEKEVILKEIHEKFNDLCIDQFGNYVWQHVIEKMGKGKIDDKIFNDWEGNVFEYSLHKFASNVLEKCWWYGLFEQIDKMIDEIIQQDDENPNAEIIVSMVKDKFGNYVIQKMIEAADKDKKELMVKKIINSQAMKKRDGFSKHVLNSIEKMGIFTGESGHGVGMNRSGNYGSGGNGYQMMGMGNMMYQQGHGDGQQQRHMRGNEF